MKIPAVTQWFEGPPPRIGVWETTSDSSINRRFQYWNGWQWKVRGNTPEEAFMFSRWVTDYPPTTFRGLADKPAKRGAVS